METSCLSIQKGEGDGERNTEGGVVGAIAAREGDCQSFLDCTASAACCISTEDGKGEGGGKNSHQPEEDGGGEGLLLDQPAALCGGAAAGL